MLFSQDEIKIHQMLFSIFLFMIHQALQDLKEIYYISIINGDVIGKVDPSLLQEEYCFNYGCNFLKKETVYLLQEINKTLRHVTNKLRDWFKVDPEFESKIIVNLYTLYNRKLPSTSAICIWWIWLSFVILSKTI